MHDLDYANFFCLHALLALRYFEFYALTFCHTAEAVGLNRGVMDDRKVKFLD